MSFWSEKRAVKDDLRSRMQMSLEQFADNLNSDQKYSLFKVEMCRLTISQIYQINPEMVYPSDCFYGNFAYLQKSNFDLLELIFTLEDNLGCVFSDDDNDRLSDLKSITVADWVNRVMSMNPIA